MKGYLAHSQNDVDFLKNHYEILKPLKINLNFIWVTFQNHSSPEDFAFAALYNITGLIYRNVADNTKFGTVPQNIVYFNSCENLI